MHAYLFILLGLVFLVTGIYFLLRQKTTTSFAFAVNANPETTEQKPLHSLNETDPVDYSHLLEEAITVAIADGTLSLREENLLREKSKLAGKDPDELIQQIREDLLGLDNAETELVDPNVKAGLDFEKYVVQKFNPQFFQLDEWTGDKFVAGRYANASLQPDIQVTLKTAAGAFSLAVECKWRSKKDGDFIWFTEDKQLIRYQEFAKQTGKPTFIVLGVGGNPNAPEELYLIPVFAFKRGIQHQSSLNHFRKANLEQGFFFDAESNELM